MDHMRISGTEPSSVSLSQTMLYEKLKIKVKAEKCLNKLKPNVITLKFDPIFKD